MDSIERDTLVKAGELVAALDHSETGNIHTVTVTLDGHIGGCQVKVESELADDIVLLVK
jgi:hypothetical protein